jgi:hypothetical protein
MYNTTMGAKLVWLDVIAEQDASYGCEYNVEHANAFEVHPGRSAVDGGDGLGY